MEDIQIMFGFIKNLVWGLVSEGILAIIAGVLVFVYPDLLGMLVGALLVLAGVISLALALKANGYSKMKIKL
ncbi:MAG: hypothetical protein WCX71_00520 [Candidatus Buchananbacteria bacterium]